MSKINPNDLRVMPWNITIEEYKRRQEEGIKKIERTRIIKIIKSHIGNTYPHNCNGIIEEIQRNSASLGGSNEKV
jgi:hypothetical protein